ncbi:primosomal protein N' [Commensalibacter papalotli (ex Botero et al. 2024)]|uniref:primosomal protein N' n=1 Tax=Commensalibacter papalotli (ex Botero et al. 2024) TaxID=2972766 RepID=UPI0022FF9D17|nr:primosomal protein N' [Commensalibacter papalotli (ex Botero et al. 2024)]CAI3926512.1 Primosomal protein N' (replication factor Y) -superfamily II helicase (PriA) (PDB:6DCR) [Commensalibacter papalotli (ex Botero et al. 2024)]
MPPSHILPVLLPYPLKEPFYYQVPPELEYESLRPGTLIIVPLGSREEMGVIWEKHSLPKGISLPEEKPKKINKIKSIISILPIPPLPTILLEFIDWVAAYTISPPGLVLAIALRGIQTYASTNVPKSGWILSDTPIDTIRVTPAREKIIQFLKDKENPFTTGFLTDALQVSSSVIQGLAKAGIIEEKLLPYHCPFLEPDPSFHIPLLSDEQQEAANFLSVKVKEQQFSVTLLQGVTGSGKTEVYMQAIATCIEQGQQVLILLPEIALSSQWIERFEKRFGVKPALWHSDLTNKQRKLTWQAVINNEVSVLVGARSALFLPFTHLGLIIIDEEHETSFKQEEGIIYHARDMAIVRARLSNCPAVLVSATPSLETLTNAYHQKYHHLTLTARHGGASMPDVQIVDLRATPPHRGLFLSPPLIIATQQRLEKDEQVLFFLNRRGYAPLTLCRACGHRLECPHCSAWLVEHRRTQRLVCHHCEYFIPIPKECPHCDAPDSMVPIGPGIERITEEARATFPDAKILVMSSDSLTSPKATAEAIRQIDQKEVNLIIGTQIVAKGWHFPFLTLVGVIDADLGLSGADLRASEKTLQLLHQVGGRAGRAQSAGIVMLQSYLADHPVMETLVKGDFNEFMLQEAAERQMGFWPPYGRLAAIIVSADTSDEAMQIAYELGQNAPQMEGVIVLGPAPAPLALLRNRYRQRLLLRTQKHIAIQPILHQWLSSVKAKKSVKIDVDIDPISFL